MAVGDCYVASGRAIMERDEHWRLCHGTVVGTGGDVEGVEYGHAWVESADGGIVIDVANGATRVIPRDAYYRVGQVKDVVRYTGREAEAFIVRSRHWGPWHENEGGERDG